MNPTKQPIPKPLGYRIYDEQIAAKVDETLTLREQFEKHVNPADEDGAIYLEGLRTRVDAICSLRGGPRGAFHKLRLYRVETDAKEADEFRLVESAIADLGQISTAKPIAEPHPDTALIAACEKVIELQIASYTATGETEIEQDERTGSILAEMEIAVDRLVDLRAVTPLGILARARALDCADPDHAYTFDNKDTLCGRQLAALRRDTAEIGHLPRAGQLQAQLTKAIHVERRAALRRARRKGRLPPD